VRLVGERAVAGGRDVLHGAEAGEARRRCRGRRDRPAIAW
jgi:hypothetical protein